MYLIRQNSFDIQCSSQPFGMELQQQLSDLLEKTFYPQLEQLLVKYDVPGTHWIIDLLEVEVSDISKKYWKEELIQKALVQIEEYLIRNSPKTDLHIAELLGNNAYTIPSEKKAKLLVFDFLRNGFLPLNAFSDKIEKIIAGIVIDKNFVNQLLEFFQSDMKMVMRWIFSIPEEYKVKVLAFLPSSFNGFQFTEIILNEPIFQENKMKTIIEKLFSNPKHIQYWYELIQWADNIMRNGVSPQEVFSFLNHSIEKYWNTSATEINQLFEPAFQKVNNNDADAVFFKLWQKQLNEKEINEAPDVKAESKLMNALLEQLQNGKTFSEGDVFYVNNAGLVILHPFLSTLFEKLELTKSNEWISEHAKQKAVLLTHYLVFGEQEIEENQLILNKILCGLPIEEVINTQIILEEEDKETCLNLLDAVLEHWSIMKNSSKEALRETFLKREGKLEIQINGFEMWTEEKGYDILLEQLPWGIGMIKTPWMDSYLICNWN